MNVQDRVGLGWRPQLAAGILTHLDQIDVVEVMADDFVGAPSADLRALQTLSAQVPVRFHSVGLGLASTTPVANDRLSALARLIDRIQPEEWSEHLAFVRADGIEIGHLAAPPRNHATVDGAARNLARARAVVGTAPLVENVATLMQPPASDLDEASWITAIVHESQCDLLLDLHNLYCNAANFGFDIERFLAEIPLDRVAEIHLAGGRELPAKRLLDDHLHDVPTPVYQLLTRVAARVPQPLTVIIERDGRYPSMETLLAQLERARSALAEGRRQSRPPIPVDNSRGLAAPESATTPGFEAFLARLFTDDRARERFLSEPRAAAAGAGLATIECEALEAIDRTGLELAATSFAAKRNRRNGPSNRLGKEGKC